MRLTLRVIAILSLIVSIVWLIFVRTFDPIIAFLASLTTLIATLVGESKGNVETLDQRNRRIMLNHVEEFWVKGILEKSLYGAALLDLGIKEDPEAVNYPWTIKRESTKETLPLGKPMLDIFQEIGLGRSLLILGAPGSGKTTMLLELARQLIERARADENEPIPVVFSLASWTEKQSITDWLAEQLRSVYYVPKKTSPGWVTNNKMLLLLDGLDEVKQESRLKCVEAINAFRKEYGLTSMAVCSRSQDYEELKARLSFDGAIEIQPLTSKQVAAYFEAFGNQLAGVKQVLKTDKALREMAESPLFLSIMVLTYRDKKEKDILVSGNLSRQRKHLFDSYVDCMYKRDERAKSVQFNDKEDILQWLSWLAGRMIKHNQTSFFIENMQPSWIGKPKQLFSYNSIIGIIFGLLGGFSGAILIGLSSGWNNDPTCLLIRNLFNQPNCRQFYALFGGLFGVLLGALSAWKNQNIITVDSLSINLLKSKQEIDSLSKYPKYYGLFSILCFGVIAGIVSWQNLGLALGVISGLLFILLCILSFVLLVGLESKRVNQIAIPEERLILSAKNFLFLTVSGLMISGSIFGLLSLLDIGLIFGLVLGMIVGLSFGGYTVIKHYSLRFVMSANHILPWKLIPFLDHCCDLIFLRRVGGGYIFVHRLLMEHFADMYTENA